MTNTRSLGSAGSHGWGAPPDAEQTAHIADVAEEIVDQISEADQDWRAIERGVRVLLGLVECRGAAEGAPASKPRSSC